MYMMCLYAGIIWKPEVVFIVRRPDGLSGPCLRAEEGTLNFEQVSGAAGVERQTGKHVCVGLVFDGLLRGMKHPEDFD